MPCVEERLEANFTQIPSTALNLWHIYFCKKGNGLCAAQGCE